MKIQYASDLHLEFPNNRHYLKKTPIKPVGDILILAGDICYLIDEHFEIDFFDYVSDHWEHVYIIPGNHEFYKYSFDIKKVLPTFQMNIRSNVEYLNNKSVEIGHYRILFTTLWTNIKHHQHIEERMNDFHICTYNGEKFKAENHNYCHSRSMDFLNKSLSNVSNGRQTIVVSHHVPFDSSYCEYPFVSDLSEGFHVDLSTLIKEHDIDYWVYGHNHLNQSPLKLDKTIFLTNQLGYVQHNEHELFKVNALIN